jgi:hypothetical protein
VARILSAVPTDREMWRRLLKRVIPTLVVHTSCSFGPKRFANTSQPRYPMGTPRRRIIGIVPQSRMGNRIGWTLRGPLGSLTPLAS